jgi:tRNA dimethylallyltransferase
VAAAEAALPQELLSVTLPVIVGPTASGKTEVAAAVAEAMDGEIVVADSRQVYRRLEIATNKPSAEMRRRLSFHLLDVCEPDQHFNVAEFMRLAAFAIADIRGRGRLPVVEGGSMLYVDALTDGFSLAGVPPQPSRRRQLEAMSQDELGDLLRRLDPAARLDLANRARLVRAIEILEVAGPPLSRLRTRRKPDWEAARVGISVDREQLYRRLEMRSREQVANGLVEETRRLLESGVPDTAPALGGIGYREAVAHLRGRLSADQLVSRIAQANRNYARRQLTWLRKDGRIRWFEAGPDLAPRILGFLEEQLS